MGRGDTGRWPPRGNPSPLAPNGAFVRPRATQRGDFDGDGLDDLLSVGFDTLWATRAEWGYFANSSGVAVLPGRAAVDGGSFQRDGLRPDCWCGGDATVGDLDGDGLDDLVVGTPGGALGWYGAPGLAWTDQPHLVLYELYVDDQGPVELADVDGDGFDDLLAGAGVEVIVFFGGRRPPWAVTPVDADLRLLVGDEVTGLHVADLDGDGLAELAIGTSVGLTVAAAIRRI